jgi:AcrR family transcriptional regulator
VEVILSVTATILERPPPEAGRREWAKNERRRRVVDAACSLLRDVGVEAWSMKMLATRAGVSLSTVYNLFGSKQAVLSKVFDLDLLKYEQLVADAQSRDALERLFDAVDIAAELYRADPGFYQATMRRLAGPYGPFLNLALREPRTRFWRGMIAEAIAEGLLKPDAHPAVLGALAVQIFGGALADWTDGEITVDQLRDEVKFGFAVAFYPFSTEAPGARLREMIANLHQTLAPERGALS